MSSKVYRQARFQRPAGATEIILIRHGESAPANPDIPFELIDGQGNPPLSELGQQQALQVGERLAKHEVAAIYVTNLTRTSQTAQPLADKLGLALNVVAELREVHLGDWEGGLFRVKAANQDPAYVAMHEQQEWGMIPGGETNQQLQARLKVGLKIITQQHPDQLVVVVSHGGAIGQILAQATGAQDFAFNGCDNASISHIVIDGERTVVRRFNDCSHLRDEIGSTAGAMT